MTETTSTKNVLMLFTFYGLVYFAFDSLPADGAVTWRLIRLRFVTLRA